MLIAVQPGGDRVEASRDLPAGTYQCPMCESPVILKRGQKIAAHFAHTPDSGCPGAEPESWRHLLAKRVLAEEFTALGWVAQVEVSHPQAGRRVDVGVRIPTMRGARYIAVEVQDSAIQVDTMKARVAADQRIGYAATAWLFTSNRAANLLYAQPEHEVRVPDEMLWVSNRYGQGIPIIDPETRTITVASLGSIHRDGESRSWYDEHGDLTGAEYPGRTLRKTKTVNHQPGGFQFRMVPGKFRDRWAAAFAA
ncbi:competence protein CoiA [Streptomyces misionensis]|uniref:competence protein CoiA n=1 Tax=Streptomyces misionensis TaxID=67331 RepID=UPI0036A03BC1